MLIVMKKVMSAVLILTMVIATISLVACEKEENGQPSATAAKTAVVSASAAKTTAAAKSSVTAAASGQTTAAVVSGQTQAAQTEAPETTETVAEATETGEGGVDPVEEKVVDLGGRTIDIDLIYVVRIPAEDNPVPARALEWRVSKEIEKKYNCVINYIATYANNNTLTLNAMREKALSGTETIEVQYVSLSWIMPSMVEGSYFLKLDEYIPRDSFAYENFVKDWTEWKGHGYGFCFLGRATGSTRALSYNKEIMDRHGIDIWENYVDKGIWTWENFLKVALATTQDFDGDGIVDQWGLKGWNEEAVAYNLIASNGARILSYGADGSVKYTLDNDAKAVKALQFMSDLYNVHKVTFVGGNVSDIMQRGFGAMSFISVGSFSSSYYKDAQCAKKMFVAPVPKGPDFDQHIDRYQTSVDTMTMPNITSNPNSEIVQVMAELYSESHRQLGMGGGTFDVVNVNAQICQSWFMNNLDTIPEFLDIIRISASPIVDNVSLFNPLPAQLRVQVLNQIAQYAVPVTTKLMETKDVMQGYIDAVLN
ncbi:MAG: extracellular solute-binding protein [Eubacteriales bacterium]|nr:extracellular solute-binding protein [Eubacteriales bacterium]